MDELLEKIRDKKNLEFINRGTFGEVYKLEYKGELYAIKKISKENIDYNENISLRPYLKNALLLEINFLVKMSQYKNSVHFYRYYEEKEDYYLVFEYCDTDLKRLIYERFKNQNKRFSSKEILYIMEGLNQPLKFLIKNDNIHRDIKPDNILIKYNDSSKTTFVPKIADYGLAKKLKNGMATTCLGTPGYMAPEIILNKPYNNKSDLFSIGVMIYKLYFYYSPFPSLSENPSEEEIIKVYCRKKEKDCEDKVLDDLINRLLEYDPKKRINWDDYFAHQFFNQNKVDNLTIQLDNLKIYDENEHQIIKVYDYTFLEQIIAFKTAKLKTLNKTISITDCLNNKKGPFFILGILGKYLETIGISVTILANEEDELKQKCPEIIIYNKYIIQLICNSYILKNKYILYFDFGLDKIKYLLQRDLERSKFNEKIRKTIMKIYNLKDEEIQLSNHRREKNNKFTVIIVIKSNFKIDITKDKLIKVYSQDEDLKKLERVEKELLMPQVILSKSMLNPYQDNFDNKKWSYGEKRGGEKYFPPKDWDKYGIYVGHNFDDITFDWLQPNPNNKIGEWSVAYCLITGINKTMKQLYANDDDFKHPDEKVGVGVYCPSDPNLLEKYTETIKVNGHNYKVGFQVRIRPDKIRASKAEPKMWVLNGNDNEIRPYGILIKEVKSI